MQPLTRVDSTGRAATTIARPATTIAMVAVRQLLSVRNASRFSGLARLVHSETALKRVQLVLLLSIAASQVTDHISIGMATALAVSHTEADDQFDILGRGDRASWPIL
ncbi:hypothetical protein GCM10023306_26230 [Novosphingobium ginsenosidimutans]